MTRLASVLTLLAAGTAHAGCPVAVVKAAPVYHAPAYQAPAVYQTAYAAQVLTLAVPVAVVTPYPVAGGPTTPAAPAESAELKSLREEIAALRAAQQRQALKEELRAELLRELQQAPPKK